MTRPPVRGDNDWADDDWSDQDAQWAAEDAEWADYADEGAAAAGGEYDADDPAYDDAGAPPPPTYEYLPDYEDLPPESSRGRRVLVVLAIVVAFFVIVIGGAGYYIRGQLDPPGPQGAARPFTIESGSSANSVASDLEAAGIIRDAQVFRWYLRFKGTDGFEAGDYTLNENMAAWDALGVLQAGPAPIDTLDFTVPPGLTMLEIPGEIVDDVPSFSSSELAQLISTQTVRPQSLEPGKPLEGFLYPDTYQIRPADGPAAALQRMADQMDQVILNDLNVPARASELGRSTYEIITIASLIQEEYGIPEEMSKIARVIYNRLDMGEPLGIDATSRYLAEITTGDRNDVDFSSDSPYNTRRQAGLPPTPIAAPTRAAIEAALAPADGPWIYYVRDPDESRTPRGGHFFTDSAAEFQDVKDECEAADLGCG